MNFLTFMGSLLSVRLIILISKEGVKPTFYHVLIKGRFDPFWRPLPSPREGKITSPIAAAGD
jgi:hypothetical protein